MRKNRERVRERERSVRWYRRRCVSPGLRAPLLLSRCPVQCIRVYLCAGCTPKKESGKRPLKSPQNHGERQTIVRFGGDEKTTAHALSLAAVVLP